MPIFAYPAFAPQPIASIHQKCTNPECGKWFPLPPELVALLEKNWTAFQKNQYVRAESCTCTKCKTVQRAQLPGKFDKPYRDAKGRRKCEQQRVELAPEVHGGLMG